MENETWAGDRRRGALLGLAIGDALGAAVEFRPPGTFPPVTGYRAGGPHNIDAGMWTDDTSMALAMADSIGEMGWNLHNQMTKYVAWWQEGKYAVNGWCFDIGGTTRDSLSNFLQNNTPVLECSDPTEGASGNGSIMRLAPVAIKYHNWFLDDMPSYSTIADDSSRTTHASPQCRSACRYLATVLAGLIHGERKEIVLDSEWHGLKELVKCGPLHPLIQKVAEGSYKNKTELTIRGSGWVVQSLEAALWAFWNSDNFEEAVLKAVNLGDDSDTTGAVCGQLAGAYWGEAGIPEHLLSGLARRDMIEHALTSLMGEDNVPE
jgi:ADP-ribosylglycohydrolase